MERDRILVTEYGEFCRYSWNYGSGESNLIESFTYLSMVSLLLQAVLALESSDKSPRASSTAW